ncbi:hypothetical protein LOD99_7699 [Oopsacas minuta]|uniref:Uncharacterized protein n=1 Tax=Oopsacas minuta TaxID=111878 RepID=A0AAV7JQA8_9METZ|nr:hypothetical protein LOD99_7699 [Oopsacas minuta]
MSGLEKYVRRHCESESRYLSQDPLRKEIEYANTVMHYVWFVQTRQRTSNITKSPIVRSLTSTNLALQSNLSHSPYSTTLSPGLKQYVDKISKKINKNPALKSNKRPKQISANKSSIPRSSLSPPDNSSPDSLISLPHSSVLRASPCIAQTRNIEGTLSTIPNYSLPLTDYTTYPCMKSDIVYPEMDKIPCFAPYMDHPPDFKTFESMVEWNNLNI